MLLKNYVYKKLLNNYYKYYNKIDKNLSFKTTFTYNFYHS